jgi:hypothetical protein
VRHHTLFWRIAARFYMPAEEFNLVQVTVCVRYYKNSQLLAEPFKHGPHAGFKGVLRMPREALTRQRAPQFTGSPAISKMKRFASLDCA